MMTAESVEHKMRAIAAVLDRVLNEGAKGDDREIGFVFLLCPYHDPAKQAQFYVSNGLPRERVAELLREQLKRFEP